MLILVHEYSHFEQWRDKRRAFTNDAASYDFFLWIHGKRLSRRKAKDAANATRNVELDCEKLAVQNVKKFGLPLDVDAYIQQANAYVHFHNWAYLRRQWYRVGHCPYTLKEVVSQMPTVFASRYDETPQKYLKLFDKGYDIQIYDPTLTTSELGETLPHITPLLNSSFDEVVNESEVLVITKNEKEFAKIPAYMKEDQILMDFVGAVNKREINKGRYLGICW